MEYLLWLHYWQIGLFVLGVFVTLCVLGWKKPRRNG